MSDSAKRREDALHSESSIMSTIKGFVQNERIEIRENNGRSVCNFDICVSEGAQYKDTEGNYKPRTGWRAIMSTNQGDRLSNSANISAHF